MAITRPRSTNQPYGAYYRRDLPQEDEEITHVGPGTPCGEYFRRFWHPIARSSELQDLPHRIRVLGEDLVVFRDRGGRVGLLQPNCSHRGTSLEYGVVAERGLRCCYHGWLYDVDGTILETPGEPPDSTFKQRICHGAYPVEEYKGLVFAYMGPPEAIPPLPLLDTFDMPGFRAEVGPRFFLPCNWLQIKENCMDPAHGIFLHTTISGAQFSDAFAELGFVEYLEMPWGLCHIHTRRIGDLVWVHLADFVAPNMHQFPLNSEKVSGEKQFGPPQATVWAVPVDDTNTMTFRFEYVSDADPSTRTGTNFGQDGDRPYEERQRKPGDWDAMTGQGPIAVHAREHLATTDRGVIMFRQFIRAGIRAVASGEDPKGIIRAPDHVIRTYTRHTILRIPPAESADADRELLLRTGREVFDGITREAVASGIVGASR